MKNYEKFKTPTEQNAAFLEFCNAHSANCSNCSLLTIQDGFKKQGLCRFIWLSQDESSLKIANCPYCHKECHSEISKYDNCGVVKCNYCGYESGHIATLVGAIERHNQLCASIHI